MTLARPEALLLLAVAVVIVLLYLLHPRTRRLSDPFHFLWAAGDVSRPRFGWLLQWLEALLLCAALTAIVLALAGPGYDVPPPAESVVIVALSDPTPATAERAQALLDAPGADIVQVLAATGDGVRTPVPATRRADGPVRLPVGDGDLRVPDDAARASLRHAVAAAARVFTAADVAVHWVGPLPRDGLPKSWRRYLTRGAPQVTLTIRGRSNTKLEVEARNRGVARWRGRFTVTGDGGAGDGATGGTGASTRSLTLAPGASELIEVARPASGRIEIALLESGPPRSERGESAEAERVVAIVGDVRRAARPRRIAVVTEDDDASLLGPLFASLGERLDRARSGAILPKDAAKALRGSAFDLVFFLEPPPTDVPLRVPAVFFGGPGPLGRAIGPPAEDAAVTWFVREHPLLRWVDLGAVVAEAVTPVRPSEGVQVLASGADGPLVLYRPATKADPPAIAFPFALSDSTLRIESALPFLVINLLERWGERPLASGTVGEPMALFADGEVSLRRDGDAADVWRGATDEGFPFRPRRVGAFRAVAPWSDRAAFVNPAAPAAARVAASDPLPAPVPRPAPADVRSDVSHWFAWLALALLALEWVVFHYRRR